jgi:DNA-binding NtrC family response regulator
MTTVLVVDDDAQVREMTCLLLGVWGIEARAAATTADADAILAAGAPPVVLVDARMEDGHGVRWAIALHGRAAAPRVLVTSGDADAMRAAAALGIVTLPKPVKPDVLRRSIEAALGR